MIWIDCLGVHCARSVLASTTAMVLLVGCGRSASTPAPAPPAPPIAARPDVIVSLDGARHDCVVALYSEEQGSMISCDDIVPFIRDELRVPSGSTYDMRTVPNVDVAEMARVDAALKNAGYRFIRGPLDPPPSPPR